MYPSRSLVDLLTADRLREAEAARRARLGRRPRRPVARRRRLSAVAAGPLTAGSSAADR